MKIKSGQWVWAAKSGRLIAGGLFGACLATGCGGGETIETIGGAAPSQEGEMDVPESAPARALWERFPDQAAEVLEQDEAFVATEEGFAPDTLSGQGAWQSVKVVLPRDGREAIRIRGFGGVDVSVREIGAEGEGVLAERAVAYPRAGGTSFWAAVPGGVEEWLHLEADAVRAGEAVAAWEVEEATVRQRGEGVEVLDAGGVVRLAVTAPKAYADGGREVGVRLVGSGARIELEVDADGEAVLVDPFWTFTSSMLQGRHTHTATLLSSGKVLVAGGNGGSPNGPSQLATAESYDPATNTWSATGAMLQGRYAHTAALLGNGKVLVTGGATYSYNYPYSSYVASSELYDPATNSWSLVGSMSQGRYNHTTTRLGNGKVLVAGGTGASSSIASAELHDPMTNTWSLVGSMSQARYSHTATLLGNGKVLVAGGYSNLTSAELYNPATNTWSPAGAMTQARYEHAAVLLGNGKVLVAGGRGGTSGNPLASAELYNPATNTWSSAGTISQARSNHTAMLLGSGQVLVVGGNNGGPLLIGELYDPVTNTWSMQGSPNQGRYSHTATTLKNGQLWVAGGYNGGPLATTELFSPLEDLGSACGLATDCQSGFCVDGVCCNTVCDAVPCEACAVARGATLDGTCTSLTGNPCNDDNSCTQGDTCQAGVCVSGEPLVCTAQDQCHTAGVCAPATGLCSNPPQADGAACAAGTCNAGVCTSMLDYGSGGADDSDNSGNDDDARGTSSGWSCSVGGTPDPSPAWLSLGLLLAAMRPRRQATSRG